MGSIELIARQEPTRTFVTPSGITSSQATRRKHNAQALSERLWHMSQTMRPQPMSVREPSYGDIVRSCPQGSTTRSPTHKVPRTLPHGDQEIARVRCQELRVQLAYS